MKDKGKEQLNKIVLSKILISELNRVIEDITRNNISFNEFEKYYNVMESLITNGLTKIGSEFAIVLNNASVILDAPEKQDKYKAYKEKIEVIVVDRARKYIEESGIKVSEIFEDMKKRVQISNISFESYCYYCDLLKTSYMAKLENIDYLEIAKVLQSAKVEGVNTLDDTKIYNHNQSTLLEFITNLSEKDKMR